MQINKEADFVLKGNKVVHPPVRTDGLELYYDTKGKKNTDTYKDKLLDMSGNDRHGKLQNFSYKKLSGYQEDSELVFDGIDDKLVLPDIGEPEIVSATKNLLKGYPEGIPIISALNSPRVKVEKNTEYRLSFDAPEGATKWRIDIRAYKNGIPVVEDGSKVTHALLPDFYFNGVFYKLGSDQPRKEQRMVFYDDLEISIGLSGGDLPSNGFAKNAQLEEGTAATPYVPYIPSIRGAYQINNNIISYDRDSVKWVKDGKVIERKGINLVRNGNFWNGTEEWRTYGYSAEINVSNGTATNTSNNTSSRSIITRGYMNIPAGHKVYINVDARFQAPEKIRDFRILRGLLGAHGQDIFRDIQNRDFNNYISVGEWGEGKDLRFLTNLHSDLVSENDWIMQIKDVQLIDLTATFGAGNEPTLEEIQAEPDKWQWLPNPLDLVEAEELKGNILGDMEDIIDDHTRDEQSGVEVFTDKADDSLVRVEIDGKSYQHAGSGKNLMPLQGWDLTGDAYIDEGSGYVYSSFLNYARSPYVKIKPNTDYTYSHHGDPHRASLQFRDINKDLITSETSWGGTGTLRSPDNAYYFRRYANDSSGQTELEGFRFQLEEGSTATEYELPAPTPDYPIEIHSLNDFDVVSSVGKRNLIRNSNFKDGVSNWWGNIGEVVNRDGYTYYEFIGNDSTNMYGAGANSEVLLEPDTEYIYSVDMWAEEEIRISSNRPLHYHIRSISTGKGIAAGEGVSLISDSTIEANKWSRIILQFRTDSTTDGYLRPYIYAFPNGVLGRVKNFKLEKSSTVTPYTPSLEDIIEDSNHPLIDKINLSLSEPLRSVGDVKDRLFRDNDGLWKIEQKVTSFEVGENDGRLQSIGDDFIRFRIVHPIDSTASSLSNGFSSTHLPYGRDMDGTPEINNGGGNPMIYVWLKKSSLPTPDLEGFKNWISSQRNNGTPFIIQYEIRNYITETLPDELQDKLNNLRSFQDSNYVYTIINEADDLPSYVAENLKPTIHTEFLAKDHFKESRTVNNLLIWDRPLEDEELLNQNKLFHERFNMRSNAIKGEPINEEINLIQGGYAVNTLSLEYTIEI